MCVVHVIWLDFLQMCGYVVSNWFPVGVCVWLVCFMELHKGVGLMWFSVIS